MKNMSKFFVVLCALSLGACDHYSNKLASMQANKNTTYAYNDLSDIAPAAGGAMAQELTFRGYLMNQYIDLAAYENNVRKDYRAAKYYTDKVELLSKGKLVAPAMLENFNIGESEKAELRDARRDLIDSLALFSVPENRYALALAQTRYDCWVDRAEERPEEAATCQCKREFEQAMGAIMIPDMVFDEEEFYNDFFDVDVGA